MAPANGWPRPQRMFWIASASPNTSRPQSLACDIGVRKKPSVARGPKLIMEMRQPHSTITSGVRQPSVEALEADGNEMAMTTNPCGSENDRGIESRRLQRVRRRGKRSGSDRGLIATTISLTKRSYPVAACTASRRQPQTKLVKVFLRRRMAVSPRAAGNWQVAMLYGDLLELRISLVSRSRMPGCGRLFSYLRYAHYEHILTWEESDADPASLGPVRGT